jgi:hypothetical protein
MEPVPPEKPTAAQPLKEFPTFLRNPKFHCILSVSAVFSPFLFMFKRKEKEKSIGVASLRIQQSTSRKSRRELGKFNTTAVPVLDKKSSHAPRSAKDD